MHSPARGNGSLPAIVRGEIAATALQELRLRVVLALDARTFQERQGSNLSCLPLQVDETGWQEMVDIVTKTEHQIRQAGKRASERLKNGPGIPVVVALGAFEAPGKSSK